MIGNMKRRGFFLGLSLLAAPAIIRTPGLLMPIKPLLQAEDLSWLDVPASIQIGGRAMVWGKTPGIPGVVAPGRGWVPAPEGAKHWSEMDHAAPFVLERREIAIQEEQQAAELRAQKWTPPTHDKEGNFLWYSPSRVGNT